MKTTAVLLRLPAKLLAEIDREVKKGFYSSRSEFIKDRLRQTFEAERKKEELLKELKELKRGREEELDNEHLRAYGIHR